MHNDSICLLGPAAVGGEVAVRGVKELRAVAKSKAVSEGPRPQQDGQPALTLRQRAGISSLESFCGKIGIVILWLGSPELTKRSEEAEAEDEAEEEEGEEFLPSDLPPFQELREWICKHHRQSAERRLHADASRAAALRAQHGGGAGGPSAALRRIHLQLPPVRHNGCCGSTTHSVLTPTRAHGAQPPLHGARPFLHPHPQPLLISRPSFHRGAPPAGGARPLSPTP